MKGVNIIKMEHGPYLFLIVWQIGIAISILLSIALIIRAIMKKDNYLLVLGLISLFIPFLISYFYWIKYIVTIGRKRAVQDFE